LRYNPSVETLTIAVALVWSFKAGAPADAPPLLNGDYVYYAASDKKLYALRLEDGAELWSRRFKAPLAETPVAGGDAVYVCVPYPEGRLYALRAADGKNVWREPAGPGVVKAAVGGRVVAVGRGPSVVFYDLASGSEEGKVLFDEDVVGAAYVGDGTFLVWTGGGLVAACRAGEAKPLWEKKAAASGVYVTAAGGRAYVAAALGELVSYDQLTGEENWRIDLGGPLTGAPLVNGDALFVAGRRALFACDVRKGEVLWAFEPGGNVVGAAPYGSFAVVACEDGRVYAATEGRGAELFRLSGYAATAPAIAGDFLLLVDDEKRLTCFKFY
jgi:outer membrane protein assembly factor BamB